MMVEEYLYNRVTISLEEFIKTFLKKWKLTAVIVVAFALLFAGVSFVFGEEISAPASEEYIYWEQNLKNVTNYREHSILMQANPMEIYQETIFLQNVSDKEIMKNYVTSSQLWEDLETERSKMYANELVQWKEEETSGIVEIVLSHATEEECNSWMLYLENKILEFDSNIEIIKGSENIVTDEVLLERQQKKYKDIGFAEQLLDESQAAYTIKVSVELAAFIGAIVGCACSCVLVMIYLMFKKK